MYVSYGKEKFIAQYKKTTNLKMSIMENLQQRCSVCFGHPVITDVQFSFGNFEEKSNICFFIFVSP